MQVGVFRGSAFGGTSVINSGTALHAPDRILDWWAEDLGVRFDRQAWREIGAQLDQDLSV